MTKNSNIQKLENSKKIKIFYTASYSGKSKYQKYYDMVREAIEALGVELRSPEIGNVELGATKESHYFGIKEGIEWADAVVIEVSQEDFQLGHEATLAILNKKHVLCLSIHEDFSEKIRNRYFHGAKYNEMTVEEIVEAFVKRVRGEIYNVRFNMFLSRAQEQYLDRAAVEAGVNKSEYIRLLVEKDLVNREGNG